MPKYSIQAPNGQTYQIDGPDGATDDQVRAEVMRQHPDATGSKPATALSTAGRALYNLPMDAAETAKGVMQQFGPEGLPAHVLMHPVQSWHDATVTLPDKIASVLGGAAQHVRDMSPADQQGTAPRMDTTAFDAAKQQYGTKQAIYKAIGDHPLGPAMAVASLAVPALRGVGAADAVSDVAAPAINGLKGLTQDKVITPLNRIATAERTGTAASDTMRADATARLTSAQTQASADAAAAADRASRASALAQQAKAQGRTLNTRSSAATAQATPPEPDIGTPAHLSDIGDSIRAPAMAQQDAINTDMRAADDKYRTAMQQVADDRAAAGVGVSDSPLAKAMIRQSKAIVSPDPVARPSVGSVPADSAGGKLHKMALDVLQPQPVALTDTQAAQATKAGIDVQTGADGSKYRVIKPDLKSVDDFRRYVGKVLNGQVEGYEAINRGEAQAMYGNLSKVIDKYVQGASKPVQQNWAAGKKALSPFENVRAGQAVVGTQAGTDIPSVPAANIPGRIAAGGRDTLKQAAAVSGDAPVAAAMRSQVQNAFSGVGDADKLNAMVKPGSKLGELVNTDSDLTAAVRDHIAQVQAANQQGQNATSLAQRSSSSMDRSAVLDKAATALQSTSEQATLKARSYQQELSSLSSAAPKQVGAKYLDVLKRAHADGTITTDQLNSGLSLASTAEKAFATKATRDAWVRQALTTAGVTGLGMAGIKVFGSAVH